MKRILILALTAVLAFSVVGPAAAKKKKPKPAAPAPIEMKFFLRTEPECATFSLSLIDGEDESDCYYGIDDMFNEYPEAKPAIGDPVDHYIATEGLPLKLDPSRKVVGSLSIAAYGATVQGQRAWAGIGNAEVDVTLKAEIAGEEKVLGTFSKAYFAPPNHLEVVDFEFTLDPALAGAVADSITLDVWTHGNVLFGRGIEHDSDPAPFVTIPGLK